jgi:hypothetical protein
MELRRVGKSVKHKKALIFCTLILTFSFSPALSSGQISHGKEGIVLDTESNAAIIRAVLKQELRRGKMLDVGHPVHLSTENIASALATGLTPSNLIVITPERIHDMESQKRRLGYLQFGTFIVKNHIVETSLTYRDESTGLWTAYVYECRRSPDHKWACKSVRGFSIGS